MYIVHEIVVVGIIVYGGPDTFDHDLHTKLVKTIKKYVLSYGHMTETLWVTTIHSLIPSLRNGKKMVHVQTCLQQDIFCN